MSIRGIDLYEVRDYISKYDKGEDKTVFKLGVLDNRIRAEVGDKVATYEVSSFNPDENAKKTTLGLNQQSIEIVRFGLKGIENFQDKDGKPVKFETISLGRYGKNYQVVAPHILNMLPFRVIWELAEEILGDNRLIREEEKN